MMASLEVLPGRNGTQNNGGITGVGQVRSKPASYTGWAQQETPKTFRGHFSLGFLEFKPDTWTVGAKYDFSNH